MKSEPTC